MIKLNKKIMVIDLDGTFVNVNTFHKWMKFVFIEELKKFHLISVLKILHIVFSRYLKLINHAEMKFSILKISENVTSEKQIITFVKSLHTHVNLNILKIMKDDLNITILATAAPILYAQTIKEIYKFDHVIATGSTNEVEWKENIREEKKKNLITLLEKYSFGNKISILYTDHHDDLPLMKFSDLTYLTNASEKTKELTLNANITFEIL